MLVAALVYALWYIRFVRMLSRCKSAGEDAKQVLDSLCKAAGLRRKVRLLVSDTRTSPFSWFGYIVVGRNDIESEELENILMHEIAHIKGRHSCDMVLADLFTVVNSLNHSSLKKRIAMMEKSGPKSGAIVKSLLAIPMSLLLIVFFSAPVSNSKEIVAEKVQYVAEDVLSVSETEKGEVKTVYEMAEVDVMPTFLGESSNGFVSWFSTQMKYPEEARKQKIEGKVMFEFTITSEGKVVNPAIIKSPSTYLSEEVLRVVSMSPDWTPGKVNGKNVDIRYMMPVVFLIR